MCLQNRQVHCKQAKLMMLNGKQCNPNNFLVTSLAKRERENEKEKKKKKRSKRKRSKEKDKEKERIYPPLYSPPRGSRGEPRPEFRVRARKVITYRAVFHTECWVTTKATWEAGSVNNHLEAHQSHFSMKQWVPIPNLPFPKKENSDFVIRADLSYGYAVRHKFVPKRH